MSTSGKQHVTSRGNVVALSQALQSYGIDPDGILREGDIEFQSDANNYAVAGVDIDRMVCLAVKATGDEAFGLRFVDFIQPNSFHALGVALLYSSDLRSFCERLHRYFTVITTLDQICFVDSPDGCYLSMLPGYSYSEIANRVNSDAWLSYFVKSIRQVCGPSFVPQRVDLSWSPPAVLRPRYEEFFLCPISYSAAEGRLHLDPAQLDLPLPSSNGLLAHQNDLVVAEYLATMDARKLSSLVHIKMIELLPTGGCDREAIATSLNLTVRTMHNRLEREGVTYKALLEKTRKELAQEYLQSKQYSVSDIAYLLGYVDVGNFSRAFKRWTGLSPRAYLKSLQS